jgi:CTP synthase (UTP-ammonia lyase)
MQTACVEFARNVVGLADANSSEFDPATPHRVIYKLRELRGVEELGGTMRLGAWTCKIEPNTLAHKIYGKLEISERHRHRYEFNREYEEPMVAAGLRSPDRRRMELMSRWWNCPTIRISSGASFIPSSSRSRWSRIRCSAHL